MVCTLSYSGSSSGAVTRGSGDVQLQQYCHSSCFGGPFLRSCVVGHRVLPEPELGVSYTAFLEFRRFSVRRHVIVSILPSVDLSIRCSYEDTQSCHASQR